MAESNTITEDQIRKMCDSVEGGVCKSIDELVTEELGVELEDLTNVQLDLIDEHIFTCPTCGWTMSVDEQSEDDEEQCRECYEENEDRDED